MAHAPQPGRSIGTHSIQRRLLLPCIAFTTLSIITAAMMPYLGELGMANPKTATTLGLWVNFLGQFHPVFLHLPIGALMLVIVMEVGKLLSRGRYQAHTTLGLFFTSATALFALIFGYCLYLTGSFEGELIEEHKRDGMIFTILVIITFFIKYISDMKPHQAFYQPLYGTVLVASLGSMIAAGHHGGELTHGDPFDALPSKITAAREAKNTVTDFVIYTDIIHPILEEKCITCHGAKKKKSGLRMDTYSYMLEGGEEGECLVPGDLEKSGLISTLHLPLSDDLRMPPEDKPQLSEAEIQLLEWWVKIGAPEKSRLSETEPSPAVNKALDSVLGN